MMKSTLSWSSRILSCFSCLCLFVMTSFSQGPADFSAWAHSADFRLDATPSGAAISEDVSDFPLLLRLDSATFPFAQAKADGSDLRCADPSGRALAYEIEAWDPAAKRAAIWIRLPLIKAGTDTGFFRLHWGKADAVSASSSRSVFDSAGGFAGAWHLQGDPIRDAAGGLPDGDGARTAAAEGVIAGGRILQGNNIGLVVPHGPALQPAAGLTASLWIHAATWQGGSRRLLQKGSGPEFSLSQEGDSLAWTVGGTTVTAPLPATGAWHHVAAAWDGSVARIHVDGVLKASRSAGPWAASGEELCLGCRAMQGKPRNNFEGRLDEAAIARVARSGSWIRLAYANQRAQQVLVRPPALVACPARFEVPRDTTLPEDGTISLAGVAECASAYSWSAVQGPAPRILDPEVKLLQVAAPRITRDTSVVFRFTARFGDVEKTRDVKVSIREAIPDPVFSLPAVAGWNGRDSLSLAPAIGNLASIRASRDSVIRYAWTLSGVAADTALRPESLVLRGASENGILEVGLCLDNGGPAFCRSLSIPVQLPVSILVLPAPAAPEARVPAWDALGRFRAREASSGGQRKLAQPPKTPRLPVPAWLH